MLQKGAKGDTPVLEAPVTAHAAKAVRRTAGQPKLRRDLAEDFARRATARGDEEEYVPRRRFSGLRFRIRGGVPRSLLGRVLAGATVLAMLGGFTAALWAARSVLMHDSRLMIASSSAIQPTGSSHLTRAQMLSIFGEDVDRNILAMPLAERRRELESLPWVEHATVMRLLPNHIRVAITERTPIAFVRQGSHIGLADANGVLLEMSPDVPADQHYSFPVVTGVTQEEPDSTRAARMKLYQRFVDDLDADGNRTSAKLSEVDLSSPEDVMALIPTGSSDILVHFGDDEFLARYQRFSKNIADWKAAHPNLASVDMRYDREAVLEMKPGTALAAPSALDAEAPPASAAKPGKSAANPAAKPSRPAAAAAKGAKPGVKPAAPPVRKPVAAAPAAPATGHLQEAFAVHAKPAPSVRTPVQAGPQ